MCDGCCGERGHSRRAVLSTLGAVSASVTGTLVGVTRGRTPQVGGERRGRTTDAEISVHCEHGTPFDSTAWNTVDLTHVSLAGPSEAAAEQSLQGVCTALSTLYERCQWLEGVRVQRTHVEEDYSGLVDSAAASEIREILRDNGLNEPRHYHVIHTRRGSSRQVFDGAAIWGWDRQVVSSISVPSTLGTGLSLAVRSPHQLLHMYINGAVASEITGVEDQYDATHALGSGVDTGADTGADGDTEGHGDAASRNSWVEDEYYIEHTPGDDGAGDSWVEDEYYIEHTPDDDDNSDTESARTRTVMADWYPDQAEQGRCSVEGGGTTGPETVRFSTCTIDALRRSAFIERDR